MQSADGDIIFCRTGEDTSYLWIGQEKKQVMLFKIFLWLILIMLVIGVAARCLNLIIRIAAAIFTYAVAAAESCIGICKWVKSLFRQNRSSGGSTEATFSDQQKN